MAIKYFFQKIKQCKVDSIFSIGGPVIDIRTYDCSFPEKYFVKTDSVVDLTDLNFSVDGMKKHLAVAKIENIVVGGSIINILTGVRALNKKIPITYVAAIGGDKYGESIRQHLKQMDINYALEKLEDRSSTSAYIFLDGKNRTIVTDRAASTYLTGRFLEKIAVPRQSLFLLSCYIRDLKNDIHEKIFKLIGENVFTFNLGCEAACLNADSVLLKKWLRRADIIIGNRTEFKALLSRFYGVDHSAENLKLFGEHKLVVQTDAENPVYFAYGGQVFEEPVKEIGLEKIDTCGSGDNFQAGLISELIESCDVQKAVQFGIVNAQKHIINKSKN